MSGSQIKATGFAGGYLLEADNKNADDVQNNKPQYIDVIHSLAKELRQKLEIQKINALDAFNATERQAVSQAQAGRTNFTQAANQSLQATLRSLDDEEVTELQLLTAYGQRQALAIDRDAQKAIVSLHEGVNKAITGLQDMLQNIAAVMQRKETPDLNSFSSVLAGLLGQVDEAVARVRAQTRQGITASEQGINESRQRAVEDIAGIARDGVEQAKATGEGLDKTVAGLQQASTQTFNGIQRVHATIITRSTKAALDSFQQITQGIQTAFRQFTWELDNRLQQTVMELEKGLRGSFDEMRVKIIEEANKAADQVEPRWKTGFKILVVVLVVVVVAFVAGPAVIGAVGAAAGALGAGAAGASVIGAVVGGAIVGAMQVPSFK